MRAWRKEGERGRTAGAAADGITHVYNALDTPVALGARQGTAGGARERGGLKGVDGRAGTGRGDAQ